MNCAFRDCTFSVNPLLLSTENEDIEDAEHPYDQFLRIHIQERHLEEIVTASETFLSHEEAKDNYWDLYKGALSFQERLRTPISGKNIDRRAFAHLPYVCNDNRIRSLMCFLCDQIKMDVGGIRSDISVSYTHLRAHET